MGENIPYEIPDTDRIWTLTDREFEIAWYKALGLSKLQISRELGLSQNTVDTHIGNIYGPDKLGIKSEGNYEREKEFQERFQIIILDIVPRKDKFTQEDTLLLNKKRSEYEEHKRRQRRESIRAAGVFSSIGSEDLKSDDLERVRRELEEQKRLNEELLRRQQGPIEPPLLRELRGET